MYCHCSEKFENCGYHASLVKISLDKKKLLKPSKFRFISSQQFLLVTSVWKFKFLIFNCQIFIKASQWRKCYQKKLKKILVKKLLGSDDDDDEWWWMMIIFLRHNIKRQSFVVFLKNSWIFENCNLKITRKISTLEP